MIVDSKKGIERLDLSGVVGFLEKFPEQCEEGIRIGRKFPLGAGVKRPERVFVCGMGGSGIAGDLMAGLFPDREIRVFKGYSLPEYVRKSDMVFAVSYSGNTEETLSAFREVLRKGCTVIAVTSGGLLEKECFKRDIGCIKIPKGAKPRFALGYMLFPMITILERMGFIKKQNLDLVIKNLSETRGEIKTSVPMKQNQAKKIALKLLNSVPIVQGFGVYEPVVNRARTQFNENAKVVSFSETYPELNHNSILAWEEGELNRNFSVILIRDDEESVNITRRIEFTKKLLKNSARSVIELRSAYPSGLSRALSTMYVLDFVAVYLALLRGKDPGDDSLISKLKTILKQEE